MTAGGAYRALRMSRRVVKKPCRRGAKKMTDEVPVLYPDIVERLEAWFKSDIMCSETAVDYARPDFGSADITPLDPRRCVSFDTPTELTRHQYKAVRTFQVAEKPDHVLILHGYAFLVTKRWLIDTFDFFHFLADDVVRVASAEPACVTQLPVYMTSSATLDAWAFLAAIERAAPFWGTADGTVVAAMWADFLGCKKRDGLSPYSPVAALRCTFPIIAMDFYRRIYAPHSSAGRAGALRLHLRFLTEARDEAERRFLAELMPLTEIARFASEEMRRMAPKAATTGSGDDEAEEDSDAPAARPLRRRVAQPLTQPADRAGGLAAEDKAAAAHLREFNEMVLADPLPEIPPRTFVDYAVANGFYELLTAVDGLWSGGSLLRLLIETHRGVPLDATELPAWDGCDIDVFVDVTKLHRLGLWANLYGHRFIRLVKEPRSTLFLASTSFPCVLNIIPTKTPPSRMLSLFDIPLCAFAVGGDGRQVCTGAALASLVSSTAVLSAADCPAWGDVPGYAKERHRRRVAKYTARGFPPVPCAAYVLDPPEKGYFYSEVGEEYLTFLDQWFAKKRKRPRVQESSQ
jgi:hypothetical protein